MCQILPETLKYIEKHYPVLENYSIDLAASSRLGAVIVETREVPYLDFIIKNHLYFLGNEWGLTVFHGKGNRRFVEESLRGIRNATMLDLDVSTLNIKEYNSLLTSPEFWRLLPYEKVLVFQHDSLLLKRGIEEFLQFDYVGAPWAGSNLPGGNGGLSLRTPGKMIDIINSVKYNPRIHGNEDGYFSRFVEAVGGKGATRDVSLTFSIETLFYNDPLGIHNAEKYLGSEAVKQVLVKSKTELL